MIELFIVVLLSVFSLLVLIKNDKKLDHLLLLLVSIGFTYHFLEHIDDKGVQTELYLIGFLVFHYLISRIPFMKSKWWAEGLLLISVFIFLLAKDPITFNNFSVQLNSTPVIILLCITVLFEPLKAWKMQFWRKMPFYVDAQSTRLFFNLISVGLLAYIGTFLASAFGLLIIGVILTAYSFYKEHRVGNNAVSFFLLALLPLYVVQVPSEGIHLELGKTMVGVLLGGFIAAFMTSVESVVKRRTLNLIVSYVLSAFLLSILLLLVTQKSDFGGLDAVLGAVLGIVLFLAKSEKLTLGLTLLTLLVSIIVGVTPLTVNEEEEALTSLEIVGTSANNKKAVEDPFMLKGEPLEKLTGKYSILDTTVRLNFQLGPKGGITKGAFRKFSGTIHIGEDISNSKISVELPVKELTTFNSYRDESIYEEGYFNSKKYPSMFYRSDKIVFEDNTYFTVGEFEMLGKKLPLKVELKYLGIDPLSNKPVLLGRSAIDRTQYGMTPDPKEGNIVDFMFKIELIPQQ